MSDKPRVVLIDLSSLWWQAWMVNSENGVQAARSITLAGVQRCIVEPTDLVAICCDSGRSFRKDLSPEYKAQREKQPEAAYGELERCKERLRLDGFLLWSAENFEADDVIASACKAALDRGHEVRICSSDKDMLQLLNVKVDCMRTHTWTLVTPREFMEKFRIEPAQFTDWLALKGDSSDNIPGCKGIGDVRASELLTKYETLDRIYEALDAGKQVSTPANEKSLRENRDAVMLSRKLVELRFDVPLNFDEIYEKREPAQLTEETSFRHEKAAVEAIAEADKILAELPPTETSLVHVSPSDSVTSLSLREIVLQKKMIAECMRAVMKRGEHYGVVPGTNSKPSLFKAGADTLGFMFRLRAEYVIDRAVNDPDYIYYRVKCMLTHIPTGQLVATGMGSCNSRENKYRRAAPKKCPKCDGEFIIAGKPEYERDPEFKGGWICLASRGGCAAKFKASDPVILSQTGRTADPSDLDNTILKMAMKRSRVDATLTGTSAGDFFTQDLEDLDAELGDET